MAVEEPAFQIVLKGGRFEIRDYPALVVAEVAVAGGQREAAYKGFRLLAGYIFVANRPKKSIAMTAPVAQQPTNEKIAMTAPVAADPGRRRWVIRFTMPGACSLETLPEPNDARVRLRATPPARFAVVRFSGLARPAALATKTDELGDMDARAASAGRWSSLARPVQPAMDPVVLRRNEVMVPIGR